MQKLLLYIFLILLFTCYACCRSAVIAAEPANPEVELYIHLQSGFEGDNVQILADGKIVYEKTPVTNLLIGLADHFTVNTGASKVSITIKIPSKNIVQKFTIDLKKGPFIGISIYEGEFHIIQQKTPFGYD